MPLGKKKTKIININIEKVTSLISLWLARATFSEHQRTTVQKAQLKWIQEHLVDISDLIN